MEFIQGFRPTNFVKNILRYENKEEDLAKLLSWGEIKDIKRALHMDKCKNRNITKIESNIDEMFETIIQVDPNEIKGKDVSKKTKELRSIIAEINKLKEIQYISKVSFANSLELQNTPLKTEKPLSFYSEKCSGSTYIDRPMTLNILEHFKSRKNSLYATPTMYGDLVKDFKEKHLIALKESKIFLHEQKSKIKSDDLFVFCEKKLIELGVVTSKIDEQYGSIDELITKSEEVMQAFKTGSYKGIPLEELKGKDLLDFKKITHDFIQLTDTLESIVDGFLVLRSMSELEVSPVSIDRLLEYDNKHQLKLAGIDKKIDDSIDLYSKKVSQLKELEKQKEISEKPLESNKKESIESDKEESIESDKEESIESGKEKSLKTEVPRLKKSEKFNFKIDLKEKQIAQEILDITNRLNKNIRQLGFEKTSTDEVATLLFRQRPFLSMLEKSKFNLSHTYYHINENKTSNTLLKLNESEEPWHGEHYTRTSDFNKKGGVNKLKLFGVTNTDEKYVYREAISKGHTKFVEGKEKFIKERFGHRLFSGTQVGWKNPSGDYQEKLIYPYMDGTFSHVSPNEVKFEETKDLLLQVCEDIKIMHEESVVHFDISPDNILVKKNKEGLFYKAKLTDFDTCEDFKEIGKEKEKPTAIQGKRYYLHPQFLSYMQTRQNMNFHQAQLNDLYAIMKIIENKLIGYEEYKDNKEAISKLMQKIENSIDEPSAVSIEDVIKLIKNLS